MVSDCFGSALLGDDRVQQQTATQNQHDLLLWYRLYMFRAVLGCVAGVKRRRGRGNLGA